MVFCALFYAAKDSGWPQQVPALQREIESLCQDGRGHGQRKARGLQRIAAGFVPTIVGIDGSQQRAGINQAAGVHAVGSHGASFPDIRP